MVLFAFWPTGGGGKKGQPRTMAHIAMTRPKWGNTKKLNVCRIPSRVISDHLNVSRWGKTKNKCFCRIPSRVISDHLNVSHVHVCACVHTCVGEKKLVGRVNFFSRSSCRADAEWNKWFREFQLLWKFTSGRQLVSIFDVVNLTFQSTSQDANCVITWLWIRCLGHVTN
jgi:hypothetical protein